MEKMPLIMFVIILAISLYMHLHNEIDLKSSILKKHELLVFSLFMKDIFQMYGFPKFTISDWDAK